MHFIRFEQRKLQLLLPPQGTGGFWQRAIALLSFEFEESETEDPMKRGFPFIS